jgi:hypothetical protein
MATPSILEEVDSEQQVKSPDTEFAALVKSEARSLLRQSPNELSQPAIDSPTLSPTTGRPLINIRPMPRTEVAETNSDNTKALDGYLAFAAAPPVLPKSIPQRPDDVRLTSMRGISLQAMSTPLQGMATPSILEEVDSEHQVKSPDTEFAALVKSEARSLLRQSPNELSQPAIDSPTLSPTTGRPLINIRPMPRTEDGDQTVNDKAEENILRPKSRPASVKPILPATSEDIVSASLRPKKRPSNIKPVQAAAVAPVVSPEDAEGDEASVSKDARSSANNSRFTSKATLLSVLDLRSINLIGVYLSSGKRSALIRLSSGKRVMVKVGDKLDGGKVAAIGDKELRYIKRGQNITLELPTG